MTLHFVMHERINEIPTVPIYYLAKPLELANNSIIAIIYHPPNTAISTFLEEFADWVSHLLNKYMDTLILGDLNVNLQKPDLPNSAAFLECLESYALKQWVLDPTHQSGTLLDHVIARETPQYFLINLSTRTNVWS